MKKKKKEEEKESKAKLRRNLKQNPRSKNAKGFLLEC
jgi:hypothetical protein